MEAGMSVEPGLHFGMFVRGVVVQNHMDVHSGRSLGVNRAKKLQPLLMPMSGSPFGQDFSVEIIERGKERDRAVPVIVVGAGANLPLFKGQSRLCALQRLALAFLIAA